jgi:tRNA(Ile2)-agmatinylcytidine synthase
MTHRRPPQSLYQQAVQEIVLQKQVEGLLEKIGARFCGMNTGRGIIGAAAAIAWRPIDRTFEGITYRNGGPRWVDEISVQRMDRRQPSTFDNYDYQNQHVQIMPSSPCPVIYGIRGENPTDVKESIKEVASSPVKRWLLFETNQGTDAHLQTTTVTNIRPYMSGMVTGWVHTSPRTIAGGHVIFRLADSSGAVDCAAYEPTKQFRKVIRQLHPGDIATVCGGVRREPLTINIEKINLQYLVEVKEKIKNPLCPTCQKHMKSIGHKQGFRCRRCGRRADQSAASWRCIPRRLSLGWYEVPVVARRHLAKPLKRLKAETIHVQDKE